MEQIKARFMRLPAHAVIMIVCALYSFAAIFIPIYQLFVQYVPQRTYSLFTLLINPRFYTHLRSGSVDINFQKFAVWVFIFTIIAAVAALTLCLSYTFYSDRPSRRRTGCFVVMALFVLRIVIHTFSLSKIISNEMLVTNNLTQERLYVAQTLPGNILTIVMFIGAVACLYGAMGLHMSYRLFAYPYMGWIVLFTILPLILILFRAFFTKAAGGGYEFTSAGFDVLFENKTVTTSFYGAQVTLQEYFSIFLRSLDYAVWTTIGCLIAGYPIAYILASRAKRRRQSGSRLLMLFVLPMWMNTMLRTYAWRAFFSETGVLNTILMQTGILSNPVMFLKNEILSDIITKLVMTNDFLPFMILPIYSVIIKIDKSLSEASLDLGATRVQTFTKVIFPLSLPGVISGIQMVFMPSLTFYMIPDILNEGSKTTIGNTVQSFILNESTTYNQAGNVLSLLLLIFVLFTMGLLRNQDNETSGSGGMVL
ncbi:MAG: ABC transporter permease [Saccharofermentans sp.]|jgi:ABC-type spermidine/putrescine transport system permease subunit I|nr:ABC transporter permease [Mageeibacillus sp.]MCI1264841.1 ABC transporter permease [Saccharofermentans sp.]MCI1275692.1 ABC transporter permease [Saccharofermentans sp.]MCI1769899.1 ABC transporter permease [Mageeibacillus sp.]